MELRGCYPEYPTRVTAVPADIEALPAEIAALLPAGVLRGTGGVPQGARNPQEHAAPRHPSDSAGPRPAGEYALSGLGPEFSGDRVRAPAEEQPAGTGSLICSGGAGSARSAGVLDLGAVRALGG